MEDLSHYNPEGSVLRKAQMRLLEMLDIFVNICDKHNITYWLVCGTLLGARRHGGFIPWDDDLDVAILQSDYNRLISILKEELPEDLKIQTRETDKNYWYFHPKIRDTGSRLQGVRNFEHTGIFLDIFLLEAVPSMGFKKIIDKFLLGEIHFKGARSLSHKIKYGIMLCFLPIINLIIKLSRLYYRYISGKKIYAYSYGYWQYPNYNMKYFFPVGETMFEGKKYKAPNNIDKYLIDNFNADFMVIPKPEDRAKHALGIDFH